MELSSLILALAFSSAVGLTLDNKELAELSEEDQTLVQDQVNNFLDSAGEKIANVLKEKSNVDVRRAYPKVQDINVRRALAPVSYYHAQQWAIKNSAYCALITWIKWAMQTIRLVYEKGLDILRIHASLNF